MKCLNCGAEAPAGALECPACGVIFAKFKKKLETLEAPPPAKTFNRWIGRSIALALVILWCAGFALYYRRELAKVRASRPAAPAPVR